MIALSDVGSRGKADGRTSSEDLLRLISCPVVFDFYAGVRNQLGPFRALRFDESGEVIRRFGHRLEHLRIEKALTESRIAEDPDYLFIDLHHHCVRRAGGGEQAEPGGRLVPWQSTFRNRRNVGYERHALGSADAEHLNLPGTVGRQSQSDAYNHGVD